MTNIDWTAQLETLHGTTCTDERHFGALLSYAKNVLQCHISVALPRVLIFLPSMLYIVIALLSDGKPDVTYRRDSVLVTTYMMIISRFIHVNSMFRPAAQYGTCHDLTQWYRTQIFLARWQHPRQPLHVNSKLTNQLTNREVINCWFLQKSRFYTVKILVTCRVITRSLYT